MNQHAICADNGWQYYSKGGMTMLDLKGIRERAEKCGFRAALSGDTPVDALMRFYSSDCESLLAHIEKQTQVIEWLKEYRSKCNIVECRPVHCTDCERECTPKCDGHDQCRNCIKTNLDDALKEATINETP